jgi:hypothetical protein
MEERILTKHPEGKQGVRISRAKYDAVRQAIVAALRAHGEMTFEGLNAAVNRELDGKLQGSIPWYTTTVKLDLEARRIVKRVSGSSPQRLGLTARPR